MVENASREVEVTGSNHGNRPTAERRDFTQKMRLLSFFRRGGWLAGGVSPIKNFFLFIFGFYVLTQKTSVLASDLSARQH
jgi:hypothetical protein